MAEAGTEIYLGLISGTSADAIDAALVRFDGDAAPAVIATLAVPYPPALRERVLALALGAADARVSLDELGAIDCQLGHAFAAAARALLARAAIAPSALRAIGSHGQTVRHRPRAAHPFTLQLGDPNVIAESLGVTTVADFRRRDVAAGGEGAPLLPALHALVFADPSEPRVVLNLGGIANVTLLAGGGVRGFDTGPANGLLDAWSRARRGQAHDVGGAWAASGRVDAALLARLRADPYFALPPPKSTGREHFSADWLLARLAGARLADADVAATLVELTAATVADAVRASLPEARRVIACGGGVHNTTLMQRLRARLGEVRLGTTAEFGVDPDFVEATAFAWLARQTLHQRPGNLPAVTGARGLRVLGAIYSAS
jgi:anhydro-N-acetylmuramic acid kinase